MNIAFLRFIKKNNSVTLAVPKLTRSRRIQLPDKSGMLATRDEIIDYTVEPVFPSIGSRWDTPGNPHSDNWYWLKCGSVTGWWSNIHVLGNSRLSSRVSDAGYLQCVSTPTSKSNTCYIEKIDIVHQTNAAQDTNFISFRFAFINTSNVIRTAGEIGNGSGMLENSYRRFYEESKLLIPEDYVTMGIYYKYNKAGGSISARAINYNLYYRMLKPQT